MLTRLLVWLHDRRRGHQVVSGEATSVETGKHLGYVWKCHKCDGLWVLTR